MKRLSVNAFLNIQQMENNHSVSIALLIIFHTGETILE